MKEAPRSYAQPRRRGAQVLALALWITSAVSPARVTAETLVQQAFAALDQAGAESDPERKVVGYQRAQSLAEEAVRHDDGNADAHYALFCGLGRASELQSA